MDDQSDGPCPRRIAIDLTVRGASLDDLAGLDWAGGAVHLGVVAESIAGGRDTRVLVIGLPNGRLIGCGGVDFERAPGAGTLWMLSVHEQWRSLGIGTLLVQALERLVAGRGLSRARLSVEHDNPRAAALYRRLGYREIGSELDGWPLDGGRRYVTVCTVLEHEPCGTPRRHVGGAAT